MRLLHIGILAVAAVPAWLAIHVNPAAAQSFDDRWSIIPKAHAEPAPEASSDNKKDVQEPPAVREEPISRPAPSSASRSFNRILGKSLLLFILERENSERLPIQSRRADCCASELTIRHEGACNRDNEQ